MLFIRDLFSFSLFIQSFCVILYIKCTSLCTEKTFIRT